MPMPWWNLKRPQAQRYFTVDVFKVMNVTSPKYKVLFVCMGNICRSPAAEGVFRHFVEKAGEHHRIAIDSAGTIGFHAGSLPDPRMREAASRRGYKLDSRARQVNSDDINEFDLIVPMDHENYDDLTGISRGANEHIRLLGGFLAAAHEQAQVRPVPDPYYGGAKGFEEVLDMIESACPAMLEHCIRSMATDKP